MEKIKVGIIGATGYAGIELIRILLNHPNVILTALSSVSFEGKAVSEVYPNLTAICDDVLVNEDTVIEKSDVIFVSLPHGLCEALAYKADSKGKKIIDLGADFRLVKEEDYQEWYGLNYQQKALHQKSCYCIPELHRKAITPEVSIIANPGCYPTSIALGLAPIIKSGLADLNSIIIDSKSGVTGAGRGLSQTTHYPDCNEAFSPYKVAQHRHTPEIEQVITQLAQTQTKVTFVPHLLPLNRGIISTIYVNLTGEVQENALNCIYDRFYQDEMFVRVLPKGATANLKHVKFSNYCDISLHYDARTKRLIIVSAIDNMVKGAAGQAIQNMNILYHLPEDTGLHLIPPAF